MNPHQGPMNPHQGPMNPHQGPMNPTVIPVACLNDNYAYLVHLPGAPEAVVVDPSEAEPVLAVAQEHGLQLQAILSTHHHWDHVGGNEALCRNAQLPVYGHSSDAAQKRIPAQTHALEHEEHFEAAGMPVQALHVPGHTLGAVAYLIGNALFTGDTLFAGGCGRLFEGTPAMMHRSLHGVIGALPDTTRIYCGHEYTAANLRFAATVEPGNEDIARKLSWAQTRTQEGKPTVPSTLGEERATNPFMRCHLASVQERFPGTDSSVVLAAVRSAKDNF